MREEPTEIVNDEGMYFFYALLIEIKITADEGIKYEHDKR